MLLFSKDVLLSSKDEEAFNGCFLPTSASVDSGIESILLSLRAKAVTSKLVDFDGFEVCERAAKRRKWASSRSPPRSSTTTPDSYPDHSCACHDYVTSGKSRRRFSFHKVRNTYYSKEKWSKFNSKSFLVVTILRMLISTSMPFLSLMNTLIPTASTCER